MCAKIRRNDTKTTEIFPYIIDCMCLNISEKEALSYLKVKGFKIGPATYYRLKHEVERLYKKWCPISDKSKPINEVKKLSELINDSKKR